MNTNLLRRARSHFVHDMAPRDLQRKNMRNWVRSIRMLGDKWLMNRVLVRSS